jgi:hypothetical protein
MIPSKTRSRIFEGAKVQLIFNPPNDLAIIFSLGIGC